MIWNAEQQACVQTYPAAFARPASFPLPELPPLESCTVDIPQVLKIANSNGLKEFHAEAPEETVRLNLEGSNNRLRWLVLGSADADDVKSLCI